MKKRGKCLEIRRRMGREAGRKLNRVGRAALGKKERRNWRRKKREAERKGEGMEEKQVESL
jgi:hypothetical protein